LTRFVLDCSVAISWCFEDEVDVLSGAALEALRTSDALVPSLWPLEVANVLAVSERRQRLKPADSQRFLSLLAMLSITVDDEAPRRAFSDVLEIARTWRLSAYDAAYLELSLRTMSPLCTFDAALRESARAAGVPALDL
jgi:predicted nucleic acid-binding protein